MVPARAVAKLELYDLKPRPYRVDGVSLALELSSPVKVSTRSQRETFVRLPAQGREALRSRRVSIEPS